MRVTALAAAGIDHPELRARQYPHELSGGMRQRVLIAIALVAKPELVIADEPTSALDVTVQRQILDNIGNLTRSSGTSVLLVTHDLGVAADRADRILVMSQGQLVEHGVPGQILRTPTHSYTKSLIAAAPSLRATSSSFLRAAPVLPVQRVVSSPASRTAEPDAPSAAPPILLAENLTKDFAVPGAGHQSLRAVDDVSLSIGRGKTLALVGESGSGKTTVARLALRLTTPTSGRILFDGNDISTIRGNQLAVAPGSDATGAPEPVCLAQSADVDRADHRRTVGVVRVARQSGPPTRRRTGRAGGAAGNLAGTSAVGVVGGSAATGGDRQGALRPTGPGGPRRTGFRARCAGPGADPPTCWPIYRLSSGWPICSSRTTSRSSGRSPTRSV